MRQIIIEFDDNETMPERIAAMAADLGIAPEMLVRRALAEYLDGFGLRGVSSRNGKNRTLRSEGAL